MRLGPVLEVTTSFQYGKHGIEIRIWSVGQDNSQSWVRISSGTNKYVIDSNHNNTEIPADPHEDQTSQTSVKVIAARSKAKAKPQKRELVDTPCIIPMHERKWIDFEPSEPTLASYDVSKKDTIKQYSEKKMEQFNSGGSNFIFEINPHRYSIGLMSVGNLVWLQEEVQKGDISIAQGNSGHNLIDPALQDNVMIQRGIFHHIYHIGCAFNLHSIINNGLIPGGQDSRRRQTVFFLPIDPRNKDHEDPEHIDFSVPRRARYVHSAWKKHQDAVFWVDIDLAIREGLTFYQTRSNAIILQGTLPAYCIPKVVRLKTGEVLYEKSYVSPRPPPKISLRNDHDWTRGNDELGSTVEQQPVGKLVQQSFGEVQHVKFSKPTQPKPKPICDRSGKLEDTEDVFVVEGETSRSHEIDEKRFARRTSFFR